MTAADPSRQRERLTAAIGAVGIQVLLGYALIAGLAVHLSRAAPDDLKLFGVAPPPPPRAITPDPPARHKAHAGAASPANLKAKAAEIVAPPPVVLPPPPPPVVVAPKPGVGAQSSAGAAPVRGPGSGAGGQGEGTGSGGAGDGDGDGGSDLRQIAGRIKDSDYPRAAWEAGIGGTVYTRFTVGTTGRVTSCTVTRSSGDAEIDTTTCRIILQRFRYAPSRDARGRAIPDTVEGEHVWEARRGEE